MWWFKRPEPKPAPAAAPASSRASRKRRDAKARGASGVPAVSSGPHASDASGSAGTPPVSGVQGPSEAPESGRERSLAMRPARNSLVREETLPSGLVRLHYLTSMKPWFSGVAKRLGAWDGKPLVRKLELDELGAFCWNLVDGERTVRDLAQAMAGRYQLPLREAELAVAAFLRELGKRGIIGVRD